jgi:AcrR family transcriptional regulator
MKAKKVDHRVRFTKMVIKNSFITLLKEKAIAKITVKEICEGAQINRATFYAHYTDQYDLLQQIEDELIAEVIDKLNEHGPDTGMSIPVELVAKLLEYVKDNAELCGLLLDSSGNLEFENKLAVIIEQQFITSMTADHSIEQTDAEYILNFCASGVVGIIKRWLKTKTNKSCTELAELILKIARQGQSAFIKS